jgi:outer membrane protein assembly factor BamB
MKLGANPNRAAYSPPSRRVARLRVGGMQTLRWALARVGLLGFWMAVFQVSAFQDHWNSGTGGKPSRNGLAWELGPTNATVLWEGGLSSMDGFPPVMEGNTLVLARLELPTNSEPAEMQRAATIVAHDLTTGAILWTNALPVDIPETDWFNSVLGIRDKRVYATRSGNANRGYLYALDSQTGAILWRSQETIEVSLSESVSYAPNGDLIVGSFDAVLRINAVDGETIWSTW